MHKVFNNAHRIIISVVISYFSDLYIAGMEPEEKQTMCLQCNPLLHEVENIISQSNHADACLQTY